MTEQTIRRNGKWAKITGERGRWLVAKGWSGSYEAAKVHSYPTKDFAQVAARYWLDD